MTASVSRTPHDLAGRLVAGVGVVAAGDPGAPVAEVAAAVCSVCAEPPTLLATLDRYGPTLAALLDRQAFCVSVLAADQRDVALALDRSAPALGRDLPWLATAAGAPRLAGAVATFDCRPASTLAAGAHTIVLGEVLASHALGGLPLLSGAGAYHVPVDFDGTDEPTTGRPN